MPEQDATLLVQNAASEVGLTNFSALRAGEKRDALMLAELAIDARHTGNGELAQKRRGDLDTLMQQAAARIAAEKAKKKAAAGSTK